MGCGGSRPATKPGPPSGGPKKPLTFGKDPSLNVKDFQAVGLEGGTFVRLPGTISGQSFTVNGCKGTGVYLLDATAQVTIDKCEDCRIIVAAAAGSVFIRDCKR
jgi:hypothetical protein